MVNDAPRTAMSFSTSRSISENRQYGIARRRRRSVAVVFNNLSTQPARHKRLQSAQFHFQSLDTVEQRHGQRESIDIEPKILT